MKGIKRRLVIAGMTASCAGLLFQQRTARAMVPMGVADQQNLDIVQMKSELRNAVADERHRAFQAAIDKNVSLGCRNQVGRETPASDVVEIAGDAVGRKGFGPIRICLREDGRNKTYRENNGCNRRTC